MPVTCFDGSTANTYQECADLGEIDVEELETSTYAEIAGETGIGAEDWTPPIWSDDPTTGEDEYQTYIYETLYGGEEGLGGMTQEQFWRDYGSDFPTWEESPEGLKYGNVLEQLGLLNASITLAEDEFDLGIKGIGLRTEAQLETALTQREALGLTTESQFLGTGGIQSGRTIERTKDVAKDTTQALSLELRGIDIDRDLLESSYKGELLDIRNKSINFENELINLEDLFEKRLIALSDMITPDPSDLDSDIDILDQRTRDTVTDCIRNCGDNNPGCVAACKPGVDDIDYGEEDDGGDYVPDDPVITNQGCIDACIDEGGSEVDCRFNCTKGASGDSGGSGYTDKP